MPGQQPGHTVRGAAANPTTKKVQHNAHAERVAEMETLRGEVNGE